MISAAAAKKSIGAASLSAQPAFRVGDERLVKLTEAAGRKVSGLLKKQGRPGGVLRVAVVGGGCSGLQYKMDLQEAPANRAILVEAAAKVSTPLAGWGHACLVSPGGKAGPIPGLASCPFLVHHHGSSPSNATYA